MPTTTVIAADQSEPTIRDVLVAIQGLDGRMDGLDGRMDRLDERMDSTDARVGSLETSLSELVEYNKQQFAHLTAENAMIRADIGELRSDTESRIDATCRELRAIVPKVEEAVTLGRQNRDTLIGIKGDIARLDEKIDHHRHDHEIHVPRPRAIDQSEIGPVAA